jgi:serine/threonine-protein kinase
VTAGDLYCPRCEGTYAEGRVCPRDGNRLVRLTGTMDPLVGKNLDDRFTIVEKLGQGGMGAVYRARQHSVDRDIAVKVVHANLTSDPAALKRFLREAKLASRLAHPNAVAVLDFGQTSDGMLFLVMELVVGQTLEQIIDDEITLAPARVVRIGIQACEALEAAHAMSIVHRDLKPSNIMLTGRDAVKVLDFGLAKETDGDSSDQGSILGTPAYLPPERLFGAPADPRGDLYSLGCTLYRAGSGRMPQHGGSLAHNMLASRQPVPPMTGVPAALAAVIDKLVARDPADRYQSAAEARQALEDASELAEVRTGVAAEPPRPEQRRDTLNGAASESIPHTEGVRRRWTPGWIIGGAAALAVLLLAVTAARAPEETRAAGAAAQDVVAPPPPPQPPSPPPPLPQPPASEKPEVATPVIVGPVIEPVTAAPTEVVVAPKKRPAKKKVRPTSKGTGKMPF